MAEKDADASEQSKPKPVRLPASLGKAARVWAVVFGVVILGAGTVAVFVVDRDWGPVALIVIGALFMLAGLAGRLPYVKWGDKEFDYSAPLLTAVEALESPPEERAQKLVELAKSVPPALAPEVRRLASEAELMDLVRASIPQGIGLADAFGSDDTRFDGLFVDSGGKKVLLEVKTEGLKRARVYKIGNLLRSYPVGDSGIVGGVLVHVRPLPNDLLSFLKDSRWQTVLVPEGADESASAESIRAAIEDAFRQ